jgi:adenylate cyclase
MGENEVATIRTLEEYREVMSKLIEKHRGRVVDSPGDNLLAEFASVVDAVESAVEIQEDLKVKNAELPENRRMEFRIGINLGDVVEEGERIYGDGVNIAARIEGLAEGGGICISRTAFGQVKNKLNLGYEYLGEHAVKNIAEPVRVYRVLMEPEAAGTVIGEEKLKPKQWRWAAIGGVVVLILVAGALAIWNFYLRPPFEPASPEKMAFPLPDKPSIAVLPFNNMSGDPEQEFFADGISENIITALSKVPEMFVIARNSTFTYKGKPVKVKQVGEELGVRYILEGSVQKSGERVRITAQLIDAIKGHHLWSEQYDREVKDFFALLDEITLKIASSLRVKLIVGEQIQVLQYGGNLEVWGYMVRGVSLMQRFTREDNARARKLFEKAAKIAPEYANAWTSLAWSHWVDARYGFSESRPKSFNQSLKLAKKAIAIDDSDPAAHALLGGIYLFTRQYDKAIAEGEKSIALGPSFPEIYSFLAMTLSYAGNPEEAIALIKKAMRLHPYYPWFYLTILGRSYIVAGRFEEALSTYKQCLELMKRRELSGMALTGVYFGLAVAYMNLGQEAQARAYVDEALKLSTKLSLGWVRKATFYKDPAHLEVFIDALRKAGLPETPPLPLPDKPSIAVLPFVNMSGDPEQEYLSDGISEEIITALSVTPKMFVIARTSSFKYKGKEVDVRMVARELGVRYVLEGSVRKSEDQLRITALLVDAQTGQHVWAERYDRDLKDIFAIQDDITLKIITALEVKLTQGEKARLAAKGTENLQAYKKYLQANKAHYTMTKEGLAEARRLLEEAIALDPEFPAAYLLLGTGYNMEVDRGASKNPRESRKKAFELVKKAVALDDSYAGAHAVLGGLYIIIERNYDKAIAQCERALDLEPNLDVANIWMGLVLTFAGRHEEAVRYCEQAIRLNPMPEAWSFRTLGLAYSWVGRYEEAIATHKKALQRAPNDIFTHLHLTAAYSWAGRSEEARIQAAKVLKINPKYCIRRRGPYKNTADWELINNARREAGIPDCPPRRGSK